MNDTIKDRFDDLMWHDATLLWIELDRRDPGNRDEIGLVVEWPDGQRNRLVFTDCYLLEARMHFGIIASESILSATCSADAPEVDNVREMCRRYGGDFTDLHRWKACEFSSPWARIAWSSALKQPHLSTNAGWPFTVS